MRLPITAGVALLLAIAPAVRADEPDPKATIAKAIKAAGGKDDGKAVNMTWKDTGTVNVAGMKIDYTADFAFRSPDGLRYDMVAEVMSMKIKLIGVITRDKVWEAVGEEKASEVTDEKKAHSIGMAYQLWVVSLAPLNHDKAFKLSNVVAKKVNDKPTTAVLVERKDRPVVTLFFDKESGLLVKTEMNVKDEFQGWKEVLEETYYEEWKEAGGRKNFTKLRVVRDGKTFIESKLSDAATPEKLDAKLFEKP